MSIAQPVTHLRRLRMPRDPRILVAFQLTVNTLVGQYFLGFFQDWRVPVTAVGTAWAVELGLSWLTQGRRPSLASAYISGISVGILIDSPHLWIYALGSLLAISSKYLIQLSGRHIFNPSNFAVVALLALARPVAAMNGSEWTNALWVMVAIAALGSFVMYRIGRLDVVLAFFGMFAVLAVIRAAVTGVPFAFAIGPLASAALQLFAFFMITDPRTSPATVRGRVIYAIAIAILDSMLRILRISFSIFYALFILCLVVGVARAWLERGEVHPAPAGQAVSG